MIKGGHHLGNQSRVAKKVRLMQQTQPHALYLCRQRSHHAPILQDLVVFAEHQMVGNPQSVVTQIFSGAPRAIVVGVCNLALPGVIV